MEGFLDKIGIRGKFAQNFGAIVMLALAGCAIFGLPFFRFEYYSAYVDTYHLTNTQMGAFGTIIGVFGIVSYLFGGVVADGMSVRKVISFSLIITGVAGLFHLLPLGFGGLVIIYAVWGISTTFAFQPACVKAVRVMADDNSQGKAYGFFDGTQSIGGAIVAMIALAIFNWGTSNAGDQVTAMRMAIVFYSVVNIAMGIFAYIIMRGDRVKLRADRVTFKGIAQVVKSPAVWIIALVGFCNHVFCLSVYYYVPFTTNILGATVAFGALLGVFRKWSGVVGNIGGGYLADKFGASKMMLIAYVTVLACQVLVLFLPVGRAVIPIVSVIFIVMLVLFHMNSSLSWTMMTEGAIPVQYSGTAAGLICVAGAIPETFVSLMAGRIIDSNQGVAGYHYFFYILTAFIALGLVLILVWRAYIRRMNREREELSSAQAEALKQAGACCHGGIRESAEDIEADKRAAEAAAKAAMGCGCAVNTVDDDARAAEAAKAAAKAAMGCGCAVNVVDDEPVKRPKKPRLARTPKPADGAAGVEENAMLAAAARAKARAEKDQASRDAARTRLKAVPSDAPCCASSSDNGAPDSESAKANARAAMSCRGGINMVDDD